MEELTSRNTALQARVFSVERFLESDKDLNFFTGFPDRFVFEAVFEYLEPGKEGENINYWHSTDESSVDANQNHENNIPKQGRPRILAPKEEFFLTICRLRQGFKEEHLSHLYGISQPTVSRITISWLNFMFLRAINKVKNVHIWDSVVPFTLFGVVNQMWVVCAMLCNFQNSIIST